MIVDQFWVKFESAFGLGLVLWNFLYKGDVGVLGEMLSKFSKTNVFVLTITWSSLIQIE